MPVERASGGTSLIDVLDRVLDKGIVIDAWVRVSLVGIDLITVEARVVVASIETYQTQIGEIQLAPIAAKPFTSEATGTNGSKLRVQRCARCNKAFRAVDHVMFMHGDLFHDRCGRQLASRMPELHQLDPRSTERIPA